MSLPVDEISQYLSSKGLQLIPFHGVDHAYGYRENEPVFAFIADKGDSSMAFHNAMNLYWATAEFISRPWCLVMVTGSPMMPHNRQMLDNLASQYNIRLIEAPEGPQVLDEVKTQLDGLTSMMTRYISNHSKPSTSLGESIRVWKNDKPVIEDTFHVEVELGDITIYQENGVLTPNRTTVPLTVTSGESEVEGVLPRLIQAEPHMLFYTEHRNLPVVFRIELGETPCLTLRFEADKGNIIEATSFENLVTAFKAKRILSFTDPNTGRMVFRLRLV